MVNGKSLLENSYWKIVIGKWLLELVIGKWFMENG